jgi:hypothetical protein
MSMLDQITCRRGFQPEHFGKDLNRPPLGIRALQMPVGVCQIDQDRSIAVPSRKVIGPFLEQFRLEFMPVLPSSPARASCCPGLARLALLDRSWDEIDANSPFDANALRPVANGMSQCVAFVATHCDTPRHRLSDRFGKQAVMHSQVPGGGCRNDNKPQQERDA